MQYFPNWLQPPAPYFFASSDIIIFLPASLINALLFSLCWSVGLSCKLDFLSVSTGLSSLWKKLYVLVKIVLLLQCCSAWHFWEKEPGASWVTGRRVFKIQKKIYMTRCLFSFFSSSHSSLFKPHEICT